MNPRKPLKIFIIVSLGILVCFIIFTPKKSNSPVIQVPLNRINGIERVLMHQPYDYTFLVKNSDKSIGRLRISTCCVLNDSIIADVDEGGDSWIEYGCGNPSYKCKDVPGIFSYWKVDASKLVIHLHSGNEVGGAEWAYRDGKVDKKSQTVAIY